MEAANIGFVGQVGGKWNGNLDAFNDYLTWPEEEQYELEILDSATCTRSRTMLRRPHGSGSTSPPAIHRTLLTSKRGWRKRRRAG